VDDVARAVADPVRRSILEALAEQPLAAGDIAANFTVSRPAVSRHLRVLRESGLVVDHMQGRHRMYALQTTPLQPLLSWISDLSATGQDSRTDQNHGTDQDHGTGHEHGTDWERRFDALETEVRRTKRSRHDTPINQQETA
jgi:DNA-binding transcriptional ArsR family regulator